MNPSYTNPENQSRPVPLNAESGSLAPLRSRRGSLSRNVLAVFTALQTYALAAITGNVFIDGNNNGSKDINEVGYPYMTVNAYATGAVAATGTAVTDTSGNYSIAGLAAGAYRVEFVTPFGFFAGANGAASATSIQFANEGAANLNFGLYLAGQCGTDPDPRMIGTCALVAGSGGQTVVSWLYASESFPQSRTSQQNYNGIAHPHSDNIAATAVGVPWAMSRLPGTQLVAMMPMSSPATSIFGNGGADGTTAVYVADYSGINKAYVGQKTLIKLADHGFTGVATSPISSSDLTRFGEYGFSGIETAPDAKSIYVIDMGARNLINIDISGVNYATLPVTAPGAAQLSTIPLPTTYAGFTDGVDGYFRPTSLKEYAGALYIAGTFDGSLRADDSALRVVVMKMDLATNVITEAFNYDPMAFLVGNFVAKTTPHGRWVSTNGGGGFASPGGPLQPVVSDITFDDYGSLHIGVTDRSVYQAGSNNQVGYVISTWRNANGSYTLENNNMRGPLTSPSGSTFDGVAPSGPGGQFFHDQSMGHPYLYSGGLLNMQGFNSIAGGWADALDINAFGVRYNRASTGAIHGGIHLGGGKQFAIVGVDAVCEIGPIEIGNYVWSDTNDNGIQDAEEPALAGVTVKLLDDSGTEIGSAVTDSNGYYIFSSDENRTDNGYSDYGIAGLTQNSDFTIRIPNVSGGSQQSPLAGLYLTQSNAGSNDLIDSDAVSIGAHAEIAVTTGNEGQNNHSFDVGFSDQPPPCEIVAIDVTPGACNDNGTPANSADDYYTASVTVNFTSPPSSGNLVLSGAALHSGNSVTTVTVGSTTSATTHTYAGVKIKANNVANALTATFSADAACTLTVNPTAVPNCSVPLCDVTDLVITPGACNDNATPNDMSDDYFTASVAVTFANKPASGNLVLSGVALHSANAVSTVAVASTTSATTHNFVGVRLKADNNANALTATFSADPVCTMTVNSPLVPNCSVPLCDMVSLDVTPGACNDNGTPANSADDYYVANVIVVFANMPSSGNLLLSGAALHSSNSVSSVAAASTNSSTTHTFVGVRIKANGSVNPITATFSADPACTLTNNAGSVPSCSVPPATCCPELILAAP